MGKRSLTFTTISLMVFALGCGGGEEGDDCPTVTWESDDDGDGWSKEYTLSLIHI